MRKGDKEMLLIVNSIMSLSLLILVIVLKKHMALRKDVEEFYAKVFGDCYGMEGLVKQISILHAKFNYIRPIEKELLYLIKEKHKDDINLVGKIDYKGEPSSIRFSDDTIFILYGTLNYGNIPLSQMKRRANEIREIQKQLCPKRCKKK